MTVCNVSKPIDVSTILSSGDLFFILTHQVTLIFPDEVHNIGSENKKTICPYLVVQEVNIILKH